MTIIQKIIYTLLSSFTNRSLTGIVYDHNLPHLLLLFTLFEHMCLTALSEETNQQVKLMVSKVLMFHENKELIPSIDCYDLYTDNNVPIKHITLVLFGIPAINQSE